MKKETVTIKRVILTLIMLALFVISLGLSQLFLSMFDSWINTKIEATIFTFFMGVIWITVLIMISRPMMSLVKNMISGSSPLLSMKALEFYVMTLLFGFAAFTVMFSLSGLLIYLVFG